MAAARRDRRSGSRSEQALTAALSAIDAIYGIEAEQAANQDVAAPAEVQQFWDEHGQLP